MFGISVDEWLAGSRQWIRHVHPEDHPVVEAAEEASERGERFQAEYRVIRKDGGSFGSATRRWWSRGAIRIR